MAISLRKTGRTDISDPNITPMIDVLLVLLVIFIIAQPLLQKTIDMQLPSNTGDGNAAQIVLQIEPSGVYRINTALVTRADLAGRLRAVYTDRPQKVIFVKADPAVRYQDVIEAMDVARGAGVRVIAAVLPERSAM